MTEPLSYDQLHQELERLRLRVAEFEAGAQRIQDRGVFANTGTHYWRIFDLVSDYGFVYRIEPDGYLSLEWGVGAIEPLTGLTPEQMAVPEQRRGLIHPDSREQVAGMWRALLGGESRALEFRIITSEGDERWLRTFWRPEWDPAKKRVQRVYGAVQDITAHKRAEAAGREEYEAREALRSAAAAINSTLDPGGVITRVLENLGHVVPHDAANIMLIDHDAQIAQVVSAHGYDTRGLDERIRQTRFPLARYRSVIEAGGPIVIPDTWQEPRWDMDAVEDRWIRSYMAAPVRIEDEVIAVLNVDSATPGFFDESHAARLQMFAEQAALALRNARLFTAEREQRARAEALHDIAVLLNSSLDVDEVMMRILVNLERVVPHDAANIMQLDEVSGMVRAVAARGYVERGLHDHIMRSQFPVEKYRTAIARCVPFVITDTKADPRWIPIPEDDWIGSHIGAPICSQGRLLGVLNLDSATRNFFTDDHAHQAQAFTDQAALALRNARLFAAEHEQRTVIEALIDTGLAVSSTLELDEVLDRILANLERVVPHDAADVMLIEGDIAHIVRCRGYAERNMGESVLDLKFDLDEIPHLKQLRDTARVMVMPDVRELPGWKLFPESAWIKAHAVAPIQVDGQVIGYLNADSATLGAFSPRDGERLQVFALQAALALRNARLYTQLRQELHERQQAEAALKASEHKFRSIVERANDGIVLVDSASRIIEWNHSQTRITGLPREQVLGKPLWEIMYSLVLPEFRSPELFEQQKQAMLQGRWVDPAGEDVQPMGFEIVRPDGERRFVQVMRSNIETNAGMLHVSIMRDITEQRRAAEELRESEALYRTLVETSPDAISLTELNGTILTVNPQVAELFGYDGVDDLLSSVSNAVELVAPEDMERARRRMIERASYGQSYQQGRRYRQQRTEYTLKRKDGSTFPAEIGAAIVLGEDGEPESVINVLRDVTQRKQTEQQRVELAVQREKVAFLSDFIAGISHEFRTPLSIMYLDIEWLRRMITDEHNIQRLHRIKGQAEYIERLVEAMLTMAQLDRGIALVLDEIDVNQLVSSLEADLLNRIRQKQLRLLAQLSGDIPRIQGDWEELSRALRNVVENAIQFTPNGGVITLRTYQRAAHVIIEVQDTGIGIAPADHVRVFERFCRVDSARTARGAGLGLSIAQKVLEAHQGTIELESGLGKGSLFRLVLPVSLTPADSSETASPPE